MFRYFNCIFTVIKEGLMLLKKSLTIGLSGLLVFSLGACSSQNSSSSSSSTSAQPSASVTSSAKKEKSIYQVALLQSLTQGYYDGIIKVSELKQHGDTGIGTFEGVNGEMIVLDGVVYQALSDGSVKVADDNETVPFSNVTFFDSDTSEELSDIDDINSLKKKLTEKVEEKGKNLFSMVKMTGEFKKMLVRSELKQEKPYKTLDKALETDQREFTYENIKGTVVALYCPDYMNGLNTSGWHLHFISDDKEKGGHILDLSFEKAKAEYDMVQEFDMKLTDNEDFQKTSLADDVSDAIKKVETSDE